MAACVASVAPGDSFIKIEDSPEPDLALPCMPATPPADILPSCEPQSTGSPVDPKDPEGFLRKCSGYSKTKKVRCTQPIGRNARDAHPTFLPTCKSHRDQQSYAGWCQFMQPDGERCGRLFRWTPPYFELCSEHQGHPDTPCFFLKLPLELRLQVFSYLLPTESIGSSFSPGHRDTGLPYLNAAQYPTMAVPPGSAQPVAVQPFHSSRLPMNVRAGQKRRVPNPNHPIDMPKLFPFPLLDLFLINHQIYEEAKDLLFSTVPFVIDIRKDGTFMCGRRLLEPKRADGSSHFLVDNEETMKQRFINNFSFCSVKNYTVDILVENWNHEAGPSRSHWGESWDEEVEIYDIRDYVGVAVSGILAQSRNLCKLNVRIGFSNFKWSEAELLSNTICLVGPFERLRNVRQPRLCGVYEGSTANNFMLNVSVDPLRYTLGQGQSVLLCSVPQLPTWNMLLGPGNEGFDLYKADWERWLSQSGTGPLTKKAPIRAMFTEFKEFYAKLSAITPDVTRRTGRYAFLHRARVARENENVEHFRELRNELIQYWYAYLEQEEQKRDRMNARLTQMLDTDIYPSHEIERKSRRNSKASSSSSGGTSPVVLDVDKMADEGIPMQANQVTDAMRQRKQMAQMAQAQWQLMKQVQQRAALQGRSQPSVQAGGPSSLPPTVPMAHQQPPHSATLQQLAALQQQQHWNRYEGRPDANASTANRPSWELEPGLKSVSSRPSATVSLTMQSSTSASTSSTSSTTLTVPSDQETQVGDRSELESSNALWDGFVQSPVELDRTQAWQAVNTAPGQCQHPTVTPTTAFQDTNPSYDMLGSKPSWDKHTVNFITPLPQCPPNTNQDIFDSFVPTEGRTQPPVMAGMKRETYDAQAHPLEQQHSKRRKVDIIDLCQDVPNVNVKIEAQRNEYWEPAIHWDGVGKGKGKMRVDHEVAMPKSEVIWVG